MLLGALAVAALVLGATYLPSFFEVTKDTSMAGGELVHGVTRGDLLISFKERGTVKAAKSVPIYCELEGVSTIVSVVPEGTSVKEGDLLVELDSSDLEQQLNQQQIAVESALAALNNAQEQVKIQESLNRSALQAAELELKHAEIDLKKYTEGDYPLAVKKARGDIFIAQEELTRAENVFEWTQKLAEKGYVTLRELQADKLAVSKAKVQYEQAEGALAVLAEYTHEKELSTYRSAVEQARDALERARRKADAEMSQTLAEAKAKESTYNLSVKRLRKIEEQLAKTKIRAPQDGMVVYEAPSWRGGRDRVVEQGAEVRENQLLMNLPDVSTMAVDVQIHEAWIDQVREGQLSLVGVDALPNLKLKGKVVKVGLLPDQVNRWLNPDLKVYRTEISIDEGEDTRLLKPGMSAVVQVIVARLENVVFVPRQSVTTVDRQHVCYVFEDGGFRPRPVSLGLFNDSHVEIRSGLEPGDVVELNAPEPEGRTDQDDLKELEGLEVPAAVADLPQAAAEEERGRRRHADPALAGEGGGEAAAARPDRSGAQAVPLPAGGGRALPAGGRAGGERAPAAAEAGRWRRDGAGGRPPRGPREGGGGPRGEGRGRTRRPVAAEGGS